MCSSFLFGQTPYSFNYQGVVKDQQGLVLTNTSVSVRFVIRENSSTGNNIYEEDHQVTTSSSGVFSAQVGTGVTMDDLSQINWSNGSYWMEVFMDLNGGSNYTSFGAAELVSVPFALHAQTVADKDDADADPNNELQQLSFNTSSGELEISNGNKINLSSLKDGVNDADADPTNEIQQISFDVSNNTLTLSNGGQVDLSTLDNDGGGNNSGTDDQVLSLSGTTLSIEDGNSVDLSTVQDGVNDADADPSNEIQNLAFDQSSKVLSLTNGNTVDLSSLGGTGGGTDDQVLSLSGTTLSIEDGNSVDLTVVQDGVDDADSNPTNEIQQISFDVANNTLTLSNGGQVDLSTLDNDGGGNNSGTDDQVLSLSGTTLSIEDGNSVDLSTVQDGVNDADADPTNEIQQIQLNGLNLSITGGNTLDLSSIQDGVDDADSNPMNELQDLMLQNNKLSLTNSNQEIDLSYLGSPWVLNPQTNVASLGGVSPIAKVVDNTHEIQVKTNEIYIKDDTEKVTFLGNHYVAFNNEIPIGNDVVVYERVVDLDDDSLTFSSVLQNGLVSGSSSFGREKLNFQNQIASQSNESCMSPDYLCMKQNDGFTSHDLLMSSSEVSFERLGGGMSSTKLGLDSLYIATQIGLLHGEELTLKTTGLEFDNLFGNALYSERGVRLRDGVFTSGIFDRVTLYPDEFTMYNSTKWKTSFLGTNMQQEGELAIYGNGNNPNFLFSSSSAGPFAEVNYNASPRLGIWGFEEFGLINTMGKNGNGNTYVGTAVMHNNPNMGGMGVMDDFGAVHAGMEVDGFGEGSVFTTGCLKVIDHADNDLSCSNAYGYQLFNGNGGVVARIGKSFFNDQEGNVEIVAPNNTYNFYAGGFSPFATSPNKGYAGVYDSLGNMKASMFVSDNDHGYLHSNRLNVSQSLNLDLNYPISTEHGTLGFYMYRADNSAYNWEFHVNDSGNLDVYSNSGIVGYFSAVNGTYMAFSDRRLKNSIEPLRSVISGVKKIEPTTYFYNYNSDTDQKTIGFIAQEVQEVFPEVVKEVKTRDGEKRLSIDYKSFGIIAIKAVKEQQEVIESQAQELKDLKERMAKIEAHLGIK